MTLYFCDSPSFDKAETLVREDWILTCGEIFNCILFCVSNSHFALALPCFVFTVQKY